MPSLHLVSALLPLVMSSAMGALTCRPEGPVVPRPLDLQASSLFLDAAENITAILNQAVTGEIEAGWPIENVSFSVAVVTADQPNPSVPIWEYHHLASRTMNGTKTVDRDSQYLIGSVSKLVSEVLLQKSGLDLDVPVTEFLPALASSTSLISWQNITLRALSSHLSGVPPNYGFSEFYFLKQYFETLGFPSISDDDYPSCGVITLNSGCSPEELLDGLTRSYPITAPMERPAYSNIAYTVFMMAVESVTGKNYSQLLNETLTNPLGMKNTMPSPGDDSKAVIPPVDSTWGADYGINVGGGGLVSSLSDLSIFAHAILSRTILDTPTDSRAWLKPQSFAGSQYSFVGRPWEIFRPPPDALTPAHPHPITFYAKGGAAQAYSAQFSVLDEYGVAFVVLTAGDMMAVRYIYDALLTTFVPAVDLESREQAEENYARMFATPSCKSPSGSATNSPCVNASIILDQDSLVLESITRNGSDILEGIQQLWAVTVGAFVPSVGSKFRLFPTEDTVPAIWDGREVVRESWRTWPEWAGGSPTDLPGGVGANECLLWSIGDWLYYGSEPLDRLVFLRDVQTGEVVGLEFPFLRSGILTPTC